MDFNDLKGMFAEINTRMNGAIERVRKDMAGVQSLPCGWLLPDLKVPAHPPLATEARLWKSGTLASPIAAGPSPVREITDSRSPV